MTDKIDAVGSLGGGGLERKADDLDRIIEQSQIAEVQGSNFSQMAQDALSRTLGGPFQPDPMADQRRSLVGSPDGDFAVEKSSVLSEVNRPGAEQVGDDTGVEDKAQAVIDRTNQLYGDLTIYHVAWGVATRMQRDISQLLRGS